VSFPNTRLLPATGELLSARNQHRPNEWQAQIIIGYDSNDAQSRPTQSKWVTRTRRPFVNFKELEKTIQLVRQAYGHRYRVGGDVVALADRLVVVADGGGDGWVLALCRGVVAAHQALQLGELADHAGDEVCLCEAGCALCVGGQFLPCKGRGTVSRRLRVEGVLRGRCASWRAPSTSFAGPPPRSGEDYTLFYQPAGELRDAVDLVGYGAELFVEDDLRQLLGLLFERDLEVGVVEELRVRQARGEDLAVTLDDLRAAVVRGDVSGTDERVRQFSVGAAADEIFLVHARGELDHLGRDVEKRGVELA